MSIITTCTTPLCPIMSLQNLLSKTAKSLDSPPVLRAMSGVPQATRSQLPVEVLDNISQFLSRVDLLPMMTVNKLFSNIAARVLYHTIDELPPIQAVKMLRTLDRTIRLQPLVRKLHVDWTTSGNIEPTRNLLYLLHRVLKKLKQLVSLFLELPRAASQIWILTGCTFSLRQLSTSMPCDTELASYLDTQPTLTDLTLRGYQHGLSFSTFGLSIGFDPTPNTFNLSPTSLPRLTSLRTVHGGPAIIASVVEGRPVQSASIALYPTTSMESLQALCLSSAPLRRLSIMSFDPAAQDYLITELATHFPQLEALHIVVLLAMFTDELIQAIGPLLAPFKSLQYITFMAATDRVAQPKEEQVIAKIWHKSCPTLKTIILPRGKVWFSEGPDGQMEWSSLEEE